MPLQLNAPGEGERFKGFSGLNIKQMPSLIAKGRTPLSAAGLMSRYLEVLKLLRDAPEELKPAYASLLKAWEDGCFDLGDGALRHHNGGMNVAPDAQYLRLLTPKTVLVYGAVELSDEAYAAPAGVKFSEAQVNKYCGIPQNRDEAKKNPVWLALARDKALLDEFVGARFARAKERFGHDDKMMMIEPPTASSEGAAGTLWRVSGLTDIINRSMASGIVFLGGYITGDPTIRGKYVYDPNNPWAPRPAKREGGGVLVGVAPEAQLAVSPTLERRI
ncbi:hypothetical protein HYU20_03305 [Candidatus Woesearchaeota archaeon]|nr:hypothetical protein [Candidatus Woesearchaeota archaeon]